MFYCRCADHYDKTCNKSYNKIYNKKLYVLLYVLLQLCEQHKEEFRTLCKTAWEKPYGFAIIDLSSKKEGGKYRTGLDTFYIPN